MAPTIAGKFGIATRKIYGRMVLGTAADSIYNQTGVDKLGMWDIVEKTWRIRSPIMGAGTPAQNGYLGRMWAYYRSVAWATATAYDGTGTGGPWMFYPGTASFGATLAGTGTSGADDGVISLACYTTELYTATGASDTWVNQQNWFQNKALDFAYLIENEADGMEFFGRLTNTLGNVVIASTTAQTSAGTAGTFSTVTLSPGSQAYSGANGGPSFRLLGKASTNHTGKKLRIVASKIVRSDASSLSSGFMLVPMNQGGTSAGHWSDVANWSQAARNAYVSFHGIDTMFIALGQNDSGQTKAVYKARINLLIDTFRIANPNMEFILVAPYQSDPASYWTASANNSYEDFADALYEITQARSSYCLFLNLGRAMDCNAATPTLNYNQLKSNWLTDDVHPTAYGRAYIQGTLWSLVEAASRADLYDRSPGRKVPSATDLARIANA